MRERSERSIAAPLPARSPEQPAPVHRAEEAALLVLLAWGVGAFGGVYPWAYIPLIVGAAVLGSALLLRHWSGGDVRAMLTVAFLLLSSPILQIVPMSRAMLRVVAGPNDAVLRAYDPSYALRLSDAHPLSVNPAATLLFLFFLGAGTALTCGLAVFLRRHSPRRITVGLMWLGLAVALQALAQKGASNGKIYWFWESQYHVENNYYGPFVNHNHFAGWTILVLGITCGYFIAIVESSLRRLRSGWRERLLWFGSRDGAILTMWGAALTAIAVAQIWSMSRSGILGTALTLLILALVSVASAPNSGRRVAGVSIAVLLSVAVCWKGVDSLGAWYGKTDTFEYRLGLWHDSLPALRDFYRLGSGMNTYDVVMLVYPQSDPKIQASEAHNDYLQAAIEGGLLVVVPWIVAAFFAIRRIRQRLKEPQDEMTWWIRMGAVAGLCGLALQECSDFSLHLPGVGALFAVTVAIAIHEPVPVARSSRSDVRQSSRLRVLA